MDISSLLNMINSDTLEKIFTLLNPVKANQNSQNYSQNDLKAPYWQLPNYSTPSYHSQDWSQIIELVKLVLPLLKKEKKPEPLSPDFNFKSEILSLPKVK